MSQGKKANGQDPSMVEMREQIRQVIKEHGQLSVSIDTLDDDSDLYQAGMTSHASVNVMIALEDTFDVEFLDSMLKRSVFESVASIATALEEVKGAAV
jgi:acyl carrier protein